MVLRVSDKLKSRLNCPVSKPGTPIPHGYDLASWSGDILIHPKTGPLAVMRNDASYVTLVIPLKPKQDYAKFLPLFLERVADLWDSCGGDFDPRNLNVIVLKRTNRSLIISMNETLRRLKETIDDAWEREKRLNWARIEFELNDWPHPSLKFMCPLLDLQMRLKGLYEEK